MRPPPDTQDGNMCGSHLVEGNLAEALRLQFLLAEISTRFVTRSAAEVDDAIEETQRLICETLGLDRSTLWQITSDGAAMSLTHYWQRPGGVPLRRNFVTSGNLPWADGMVRRGEAFQFTRLEDLPPEATCDVETLRLYGTRSNATFPLFCDGVVFGALAFAMTTTEHSWSDYEIASLRLTAQIFGHVISRRQAEERAEQLRQEIQRATRAAVLGELVAALAHEINQPLTAILANAQATRRFIGQGELNPKETVAILDDIIRDGKRAGEVVRSLRSMLEGSPQRREYCCLNELVTEFRTFLSSHMVGEAIVLQLELDPALPRMKLARSEIQQLLINLVQNADHAMCATPADDRRVVIETRCEGGLVVLSVKDFGCGIPAGHHDRIFEPFHTTRQDGLGMGLAICRRIAEAHGGKIRASNHAGGGAVVSVLLPLA